MIDNWTKTLQRLEPKYEELARLMKNGPEVRAVIRQVNFGWRVRIEEDWSISDGSEYYTADSSNLDSRCEWAADQLKNWRFLTRLSYQEWKFLRRRDAEKFITLYNLKWAYQ